MGGMIPEQSPQPVDAGLGSGVTITATGQGQAAGTGQGQRVVQDGRLLGLTADEWMALSAMLNALVLAATLGVFISEL